MGESPMQPAIAAASAASAHELAIKSAEGLGAPQDWSAAVGHLQHAAELGSSLAQAELAALAGEWTLAQEILGGNATLPTTTWSTFRKGIDLSTWLKVSQAVTVSDNPFIAGVKSFLAAEACDWIIARARSRLRPARIYQDGEGPHQISNARTNSYAPFGISERDFILSLLRVRIARVTRLSVQMMESPHILHYSVGQEFKPHYDTSEDSNAPGFRRRVLTFLVALNEDYEGGETAFLAVKGRWKGRKGGALFFSNVDSDGKLDKRTIHAGLPITAGEKWILSQWIEG